MQKTRSTQTDVLIRKAAAAFGLVVFVHAFGHPVVDPACLGHGLEHPADAGAHHAAMGHEAETERSDAPVSHHEVCICEFAGNAAPSMPILASPEVRPLPVLPPRLESVALVRPSFQLPLANAPPVHG